MIGYRSLKKYEGKLVEFLITDSPYKIYMGKIISVKPKELVLYGSGINHTTVNFPSQWSDESKKSWLSTSRNILLDLERIVSITEI